MPLSLPLTQTARRAGATVVCLAACVALSGCLSDPERQPAVGTAWVAPATLQPRQELSLRSSVVATLHHGDKVELLGRRRRFVKIRTDSGAEGWTDSRLLFSRQTRDAYVALKERAEQAPSLGAASAMSTMTIHIAPYRHVPGVVQVSSGQNVTVVGHQRIERVPWDPPPLLQPDAGKPKKIAKPKKEPKIPPPPPGPPPAVPEDWLLLSGYSEDKVPPEKPADTPATPPPPVLKDDWTVVRTADGNAGWVLDRMLFMSIPDEVAQYAERARIVAYFQLGSVHDREKDVEKAIWLWAAQSSAAREYEYDSLRIFTWSVKRHRYETSWIERGVVGAGPVLPIRHNGTITGFTTLVYEKDGKLTERRYDIQNYRARIAARKPAQPAEAWWVPPDKRGAVEGMPEAVAEAVSWWQKVKQRVSRFRGGSGH